MSEPAETAERCWEPGWEGHASAQRHRLSLLPLTDKLEWLEQAHLVVRHMQTRTADETQSEGGARPERSA